MDKSRRVLRNGSSARSAAVCRAYGRLRGSRGSIFGRREEEVGFGTSRGARETHTATQWERRLGRTLSLARPRLRKKAVHLSAPSTALQPPESLDRCGRDCTVFSPSCRARRRRRRGFSLREDAAGRPGFVVWALATRRRRRSVPAPRRRSSMFVPRRLLGGGVGGAWECAAARWRWCPRGTGGERFEGSSATDRGWGSW